MTIIDRLDLHRTALSALGAMLVSSLCILAAIAPAEATAPVAALAETVLAQR